MNFDSNNRTHVIGAGIGAAVAIIGAILLFTSGEKVSRSVVDDNQVISQRNSQQNLNTFMAMTYPDGIVHPQFGKPISAVTDSDSTIRSNCRYGDGWASGRINFTSGAFIKMKCQTDGRGKGMNGCLSEAEFMKKDYKDQEGTCQNLTELPKFK